MWILQKLFRQNSIFVEKNTWCANGAAYQVAPKVSLNWEREKVNDFSDSYNVNDAVGSTQPDALVELVKEFGADLGIALDGDGDRLIMVDRAGEILDGDELLCFIALSKLKTGTLQGGYWALR